MAHPLRGSGRVCLRDRLGEPVAELPRAHRAAQFGGGLPFSERRANCGLDGLRFGCPSQELEHHLRRQHSPHGVCGVFPGNVRRRPVDRLEERDLPGVNIARWSEPQPAGQSSAEVAGDIAQEVRGNNHVELPRVANHLQDQIVDVHMRGFDLRIFAAYLFEHALPEIVPKRQRVRLVAHAHALAARASRVFKGIADNALDALPRVDILLRGDLVGSSLLEESAYPDIGALGVFAEDNEVDVFFRAVFERREAAIKQDARPNVDVEIQLESQAQENIGGVHICRHPRIS